MQAENAGSTQHVNGTGMPRGRHLSKLEECFKLQGE